MMDFHPAANIFPMMTGEEYQRLVESIRSGFDSQFPIITCQGKVLDGRNRYNACLETGVIPAYREMKNHRRVDLDNLSKAILDALNGVVWKDDTQVEQLNLYKFVDSDDPRVTVHVRTAGSV